jgi:signal transduction histidine kinase
MSSPTPPHSGTGSEPGFQLDRRGSDRDPDLPQAPAGEERLHFLTPAAELAVTAELPAATPIGGPELLDGAARFLAEASAVLASSLDYEATLATVARLAVPFLADYCIVDILDDSGTIRRVATAHADPASEPLVAQMRQFPPSPSDDSLVSSVIRSGRSELLPEVNLSQARHGLDARPALLRVVEGLRPTSAMCVPLVAHGAVGGALLLVATDRTSRRFGAMHQRVAEELARRAALAVDNARLYAAEREARLRAERLRAATVAFAQAFTVDDVVEVALAAVREALDADAGSVWLVDRDAREPALRQVLHEGFTPEATACSHLPLGRRAPLTEAVHRGEPFVVPSAAWWHAHFDTPLPLAMQHGMAALVTLPMAFGGRTLGVLGLGFARERIPGDAAITVAMALAAQGAQSLERARLFEVAEHSRREAEAALEVAERASRAKSEFLAVMSHELRTPLNAIGGYVQLLEMELRGPITAAQRDDLQRIRRAQGALRSLIDDVLDFSRLEAGRMEYELEVVTLSEVLATAEAVIAPLARGRGLELEILLAVHMRVRADARRLQQVLLNLLSNAVKFTPAGGRIRVECRAAGGALELRVSDTGQGIASAELARVFEPFEQGARGLTRETTGVGLGLAISRRLAEEMGGSLSIEDSALGRGSTFLLVLPLAQSS